MRKRSRYKPKPVLVDPVAFVVEGSTLLADHGGYALSWKLKNNQAFASLMRGQASKMDMDTLAAVHNITEGLLVTLGGRDVDGTVARSAVAIIDICARAGEGKNLAMRAEEMQAMRDLMSLHDELVDVVTVGQFEKALAYAKREIAAGRANKIKEIA